MYSIDGIRESIKANGPAPMLQKTFSDGIDDLIIAVEQKLSNAGVVIGGRRRNKTRRGRRHRGKSRRRRN